MSDWQTEVSSQAAQLVTRNVTHLKVASDGDEETRHDAARILVLHDALHELQHGRLHGDRR